MFNKISKIINFIKIELMMILMIYVALIGTVEATESENKEIIYTSTLTTTVEEAEEGNLSYASGVTNEMCNSTYWSEKLDDADKVLMSSKEIEELNQAIIDGAGTKVFDLTMIEETKTAKERAKQLSEEVIPTRALYIDGKQIDNTEYFTKLKNAMVETGFDSEEKIQLYAIAVKRADVKAWPIDDIIGYYEDDPDDEMESSILNVNEPFVIRAKCVVDGETYYWGQSDICPGWVNAKSLAICANKEEWIEAWRVDRDSKEILVVTQDKIILEPSIVEPSISEVKLMIGTTLKLVPKDDIPEEIGERGTWNNYVVYLPTRDENGNYVRNYALISQHYSVSIGFLPMTQENILKVAFSCLGNRYGWGGMLGAMDCTLYTRGIYECFGLELPRNTTWQQKVPGKLTDISQMSDEEKEKYIERLPAGSILFFSGHAMVYVGSENATNYVISATGSLSDSTGELNVKKMYSIILNPLTTRRANGQTWLTNLTAVLSFVPVDIKEEVEEPEEQKEYIYLDGANQTIEKGDEVKFRIDADISLFNKVYIDDIELLPENYTVSSGSTIIALSEDYTKNLLEGEHTIKVMFTDGGEAQTKFTLVKSEESETPIVPEEKKEYTYLDGANQTIEKGDEVKFRIDADISLFNKVYIDDIELLPENYTVSSGSTIIALSEDYTKNLLEGEHTIKVMFTDGGEAQTKFTLVTPEEQETPVNPEKQETSVNLEKPESSENFKGKDELNNPKTGDNITLFTVMFVVSIIGLIVTIRRKSEI